MSMSSRLFKHTGDFASDLRTQGYQAGAARTGTAAFAASARAEVLEPRTLLATSSGFVPPTMPVTADNPQQIVKVLVIDYDPVVPGLGGKRVHEVMGWSNPHDLVAGYKSDMEYASGGAVQFQIVEFREVEEFPADAKGLRLKPDQYVALSGTIAFQADFDRFAQDQNIAAAVNSGQIDELWTLGPAGIGLFGEAWMAGPASYFINGPTFPQLPVDRAVAGFGFNYERSVAEMLEDMGHRSENQLRRAYGGTWNWSNPQTAWEKFSGVAKFTPDGVGGVGNIHYPCNGTSDYDYANTGLVPSTAADILNYPNLTGATTIVGRSAWSSGSSPDYHRDYLQWWFGHIPRNAGTTPDGRQNNWYKYLFDFNSYEADTGLPRVASAIL